jgi:hypothetical protein
MSRLDGGTMRFKDHSVSQVLVGLHRIGIVGLADAIRAAEVSGLEEREPIVDLMSDHLATRNYIPERMSEEYRTALWREYLRHRGEDFSAFCSEAPVTLRGPSGPERDQFVELVNSVFASLELLPVIEFDPEHEEGQIPQLEIRGEIVARGPQNRRSLERSVRESLSDW